MTWLLCCVGAATAKKKGQEGNIEEKKMR